jgi:hypothetical protein
MSMDDFERIGVPQAERVIAAPVARVYDTIEDIAQWGTWNQVVDSVRTVAPDTFDVDVRDGSAVSTRRLAVEARGLQHTFFVVVDGDSRLRFRTRPHAEGTRIEVVGIPSGRRPRWWNPRRQTELAASNTRLEFLLANLAEFLERPT